MQKQLSTLVALLAIFLFSSCNKSNKEGLVIPKTAAMAVLINGESINSKLPWSEIKNNEVFKMGYADTSLSNYMRSALDNPENTGVDIKKNFILFVERDSLGGYVSLQGSIADAAKFKSFNASANPDAAVSEKDGISTLSKGDMMMSWNKERFVILVPTPEIQKESKNIWNLDDSSAVDPSPITPVINRDLTSTMNNVFNLKEENSLGGDEKFSELMKQKGDIHFYVNVEALYSGMPGMEQLSMMDMSKMYKGSFFTGVATFEDGKIIADMKSYAGKELNDLWKKYESKEFSEDMVKRIPGKDLAAFFAMNFKPEGLKEFIKLIGMEGMLNMGTAFLGFTLDDFVKANKGNLILAVSDLSTDTSGKTNADFIFAAEINDKPSFDKLIAAGKKMGEGQLAAGASPEVFYNSTEKYFVIGNKKTTTDAFTAKETNNKYDFLENFDDAPFAGYINFQYILKNIPVSNSDSAKRIAHEASLKMWDKLIIKGGGYKNGGITQHIEVRLVDQKTNSLKQLNNYTSTLGGLEKFKKGSWNNASADTTVTVMDTTTAF